MISSFLESLKYVGHLFPIAFLRIYIGYYYLNLVIQRMEGEYLTKPKLPAGIEELLPRVSVPTWYNDFIVNVLIPNWQIFALAVVAIELAIAVSYLIGYVVRPMAILGAIYGFNLLMLSTPQTEDFYKTFLAIHIVFAWLGAGRCLGVDYYFFKRRRGLWW